MALKLGRFLLLAGALGGGYAAVRWNGAQSAAPAPLAVKFIPAPLPTALEPPPVSEVSPPQTPADGCVSPLPSLPAPKPPAGLNGQLGLYAAVIDPQTLQPLRAVSYSPNAEFPLASTYKQAVLWALLRQVDAGTFDLNQKFSVNRQTQSLGAYPYDGSTARALAERMIQFSDNTATDLLHRKVGLQNVQNVADDLRLCRTRLILPTKDWWTAQAGLSPTFAGTKSWAKATGEKRAQLAERIDQDAQKQRPDYLQRKLDEYFDQRYDAADDLSVHNFSTPYELSTLVANEFLRSGLSPKSQEIQRKLMALGCCKSGLLPIPVDTWGGKGGNGWKILTFSGYFKTKGGEHVVYAFMLHGSEQTYTMPLTRSAFKWIRSALGEILVAGDGGKTLDAPAPPPNP
ncbi:serine hydrolase [Deinococcus detaillensis]|uniref:Serine hydrolase n=1 Tax=Deinococcus detaillensis TaxID=2592048 RepID=A0A553US44_9DEIO|nr:serine hydrolase [Deinococcus detaillensis]TSA83049.1 serine hydrolase [Deinococcus detaillensis]